MLEGEMKLFKHSEKGREMMVVLQAGRPCARLSEQGQNMGEEMKTPRKH